MSDEELEALFTENDLTGIETGDEELDSNPAPQIEEPKEEEPEVTMSDEEFEKLMAENGVVDDSTDLEPEEEVLEEEPTIDGEEVMDTEDVLAMDPDTMVEKEEPKKSGSDDDFDDLSDEELAALMESNGLI